MRDHFHINEIFQCEKSETLKIRKPSLFCWHCRIYKEPVLDQLLQSQHLIGTIRVLLHSTLVKLCIEVRRTSINHGRGLFQLHSLGKGTSVRTITIYSCFSLLLIQVTNNDWRDLQNIEFIYDNKTNVTRLQLSSSKEFDIILLKNGLSRTPNFSQGP